MLNKSQLAGLLKTEAEMGVGRGAPGSEDQSEPAVQHRSVARASSWDGSGSSPQRVVRSRALGLRILPRLTDDPTARDLSIRSVSRRLARVGRSGEAKALAENFMNSEAAKNDVLLELAHQSYWNTAESQESKSNWVRVLGSCDSTDQQVRPALVELAKAMTASDRGLDVGQWWITLTRRCDHSSPRTMLSWPNLRWEAILDRLPSETQVRWAERLASLTPEPIEDPAPEEKAELQPQADDPQATPPSDPEPSSAPEEPTSPTDPQIPQTGRSNR